jgi:hypothetical protein
MVIKSLSIPSVFLFLFAMGPAETFQQDDADDAALPWSSYVAQGEYAAAIKAAIETETLPEGIPAEYAAQFLQDGKAQLLNFTGRYNEAHAFVAPLMFSQDWMPPEDGELWVAPDALEQYRAVNAIEFIRAAASDRQIVIINESHEMGRHRAFMAELLPILRAEGFTHFGMEALSAISETAWENNGTPVRELGFYFGDPLMAEVLATADREGFEWFPYEMRSDQRLDCTTQDCSHENRIQHRETSQAQNIYDRVFADNPEARLVLFVGLAHLDEAAGNSDSGYRNGWMAAALSELTGIDPLTIDQVSGAGIGPNRASTSARLIHEHFNFSEPSVLLDVNDQPLAPPVDRWTADLAVFMPIESPEEDRRPVWLAEQPNRHSVWIDVSDVSDRPAVIQAFRLPIVVNAVAIDQFSLPHGDQFSLPDGETNGRVELLLFPGEYQIHIQLADGLVVRPDTVVISE